MAFDKQSARLLDEQRPIWKGFDPSSAMAATDLGIAGTFIEGAKGTARAVGAAVDVHRRDAQALAEKAEAQRAAPRSEDLEAFYQDVGERTKGFEQRSAQRHEALGDQPGLLKKAGAYAGDVSDAARSVGGAIIDRPVGAGHALVEQLPNSAVALGGGWAGMKAGAKAGRVFLIRNLKMLARPFQYPPRLSLENRHQLPQGSDS